MNKEEAIESVNQLAADQTPFLLITDFKCENNEVIPVADVDPGQILYDINSKRNFNEEEKDDQQFSLKKTPISYDEYKSAFQQVHQEISAGNTYLLNLTFPTAVTCSADLKTLFFASQAKYKLWYCDRFIFFSPEKFIQIIDGKISCHPMKGTIDADLPDAAEKILASAKEMAEHATIVDLIRNDLSIYADEVSVEKFRYIDEIRTNEKHLLQVSSKVVGHLRDKSLAHLGDIIFSLLPAGSICGAPKKKTLEIIEAVENYNRGYYTGIVGYFDGKNFDSGVMIRFIEQFDDRMVYKSGGGIHFLSNPKEEYLEMLDKVYVPFY